MTSIIIPVWKYAKEELLNEAIESILQQTKRDVEIIIEKDDYDNGPSATRNRGFRLSKGENIIFLDYDDKLERNYVEECEKVLMEGYDIVYTDMYNFGGDRRIHIFPDFDINLLKRDNIIHVSAMVRREMIERTGGFDEAMRDGLEDWDLWIRIAKEGGRFKKCNKTWLFYREKEDRFDKRSHQNLFSARAYLLEKHKGWLKL